MSREIEDIFAPVAEYLFDVDNKGNVLGYTSFGGICIIFLYISLVYKVLDIWSNKNE